MTRTEETYYCKQCAPAGAELISKKDNSQPTLAAFFGVPLVKDLKGAVHPENKK